MAAETDWVGRLAGRVPPANPVVLKTWAGETGDGGSEAEKAVDVDGNDWWVKPVTNGQGPLVTPKEYVVARVGALISAPVCDVAVVEITADIETPQHKAGLAHGSRDVKGAENLGGSLQHRADDDNSRRHAGVYALYDWCWGSDPQWLYDPGDEWRLHSHDHGFYLPPGDATLTQDALRANVDVPHPLPDPAVGLDPNAVEDVASKLDAITADAIRAVLMEVPPAWVGDDVLETVGWFLEQRASGAAARLRALP